MTNGLICPICNKRYPENAIENHTSHCIGEGAFKLRVRQNHVFKDFFEKMESPQYQRQIGQNIYVKFYGEAAVDQGGPKREFLTGRYIIVEYFILVRAFIEIPVFFHFWPMFPYHNH